MGNTILCDLSIVITYLYINDVLTMMLSPAADSNLMDDSVMFASVEKPTATLYSLSEI